MATPKVRSSRSLESTELVGRRAGVGYSLEGMGTTRGGLKSRRRRRESSSKIACANPNHVVTPAAVAWYVPLAWMTWSTYAREHSSVSPPRSRISRTRRARARLARSGSFHLRLAANRPGEVCLALVRER